MFSNSGEEALKILSQMPFDLIISDMRMPQMDGSQLLRKVKEKYPATIRFILSGQTEQNSFFKGNWIHASVSNETLWHGLY